MNLTLDSAKDLVSQLKSKVSGKHSVEVGVCPPFVYLPETIKMLKESNIYVGAQNMYHKEDGAFTGEISPPMLKDLEIQMVIIGHSERRQVFQETNEEINLKLKAALKHKLIPIMCVGETLITREKGEAEEFVKEQVLEGIKDLQSSEIENIIIAYEPIWAIGTGKICSGENAAKVIKSIRNTIKARFNQEVSNKIRILYGGSIKPSNFEEHINFEDIDGGLVGGSSLKADEFLKIIELAEKAQMKTGASR